jgi:hypothetical protein
VLQRDHAAETPCQRLQGVFEGVGSSNGDSAAGHEPQRCLDRRVFQCLDKRKREGESPGQRAVLSQRDLVQGKEREHTARHALISDRLAQSLAQQGAVEVAIGHWHRDNCSAA